MNKTILYINVASNKCSTGKIVENTGVLAQKNNWICYVAHGYRYEGESSLNSIKVTNKNSEYIHAVISMLFDMHGLSSVSCTRKLVKQIAAIKPDVIHLHVLHGYFINYKVLFKYLKDANIPIIWTFHDCWAFTGHCTYFDAVGCNKWEDRCYKCPNKKEYPKSLFLDRSEYNFQLKKKLFSSIKDMTIVAVSDWLANLVMKSFLSKYPIRTIHNGIDLNVFIPTPSNIRSKYNIENKFVVLGVANGFEKRKGLDDFVSLLEKLDESYQLILIGVDKAIQSKLPTSILMLEKTNNQSELVEYYSTADVYVNPTHEDNFPTTNIESLACGTPVITYSTGGCSEAIDQNTGIVVNKGDIDGLYSAIREIKKKGKRFYTTKCRERAEKSFDMNDRFLEYLDLYNEILESRKTY